MKSREEQLRLKDLELQESLIGFSKFLQVGNTCLVNGLYGYLFLVVVSIIAS